MKLGAYSTVGGKIGSGATGEIYRATGPAGPVAVKRIHADLSANERYRDLFFAQARLLKRLVHPSIVRVLDLGAEGHELFVAMELVDGVGLGALFVGGKLPAGAVAALAFDTLEALELAHAVRDESDRPVVHHDVSPSSLIVARTGFVKLGDFGVARVAREATGVTRMQSKLRYLAPEQTRDGVADHRADLYSLAIVMYEALAGAHPLEGATFEELLLSVQHPGLPPIESAAPGTPPALAACMRRALEPEPGRRFPSAAEFREAIEGALLELGPAPARASLRELAGRGAPATPGGSPSAGTKRWSELVAQASRPAPKVRRRAARWPWVAAAVAAAGAVASYASQQDWARLPAAPLAEPAAAPQPAAPVAEPAASPQPAAPTAEPAPARRPRPAKKKARRARP